MSVRKFFNISFEKVGNVSVCDHPYNKGEYQLSFHYEEEECVHTWGGDSLGEIEQRLRDEYNKLELRAGLIKAGLEATLKARKKGV